MVLWDAISCETGCSLTSEKLPGSWRRRNVWHREPFLAVASAEESQTPSHPVKPISPWIFLYRNFPRRNPAKSRSRLIKVGQIELTARSICAKAGLPSGRLRSKAALPRDRLRLKAGLLRNRLSLKAGLPRNRLRLKAGLPCDLLRLKAGLPCDLLRLKAGLPRRSLRAKAGGATLYTSFPRPNLPIRPRRSRCHPQPSCRSRV